MTFKIENLNKSFGNKKAVNNISIQLEEGQILGMLGRNGAGKTTTIRMMLELISKDSGQILWKGKPFSKKNLKIGYLPEERGLYAKMNVLDQIIYFGMLEGMDKKEAKREAVKWLEKLGISYAATKRTEQLSKGNQQKVQLITAIIHDPEFIILDEPFSGLDPVNADMLKNVVKELIARKKTIIFCSHQMDQVESFCNQICILKDGNLIVSDQLANVKKTYDYRYLELETTNNIKDYLALKQYTFTQENNRYKLRIPRSERIYQTIQEIDEKFELQGVALKEPSLHEIFIERTGDDVNAKF
ncbi:ABC transporter ATP-binding protein [Lysinibacillus xylanilyticus]|uniref:ABC transporter ATP-binding protein n=1 Tax=Lysinibacillus xylanilyticus TaxID=582475 RepID=A0A2M9Q0J3_9BACI|nr:ATP-binding cassette domain-containing protein [Lysinibacillus xylanilyticus]PJO41600.1 ABC transporter ATP-binding protein [Lysinibacillus xylanilyticus]